MTLSIESFRPVVAFPPASIATGWSDPCREGLAPSQEPCLSTAHDYAFGHALERDTSAVITANGGKVLGGVKHPLNTSDFSSFLLQAQASKAKVVGLANAGGDTTNAIKQ